MRLGTTFLLTVALVSAARAEFKDLPFEVQRNLSAISKYPDASSILLWCSESYVLNEDSSMAYEWHSFRYFPDEAARDAFGDPRINYIDGQQEVEVLRARTYTSDGLQIDCTPDNAFNEVVPDGLDLTPDFGGCRQLVVTLLGLENGSISEFHYRVMTVKPLLPWLEGRVVLREEYPVIARELSVKIPSETALRHKSTNGSPEPSTFGGEYTWKVGEQAGYSARDLAGQAELLPSVVFTTAEIESACLWLEQHMQAATDEGLTAPQSLQALVDPAPSARTKLEAIRKWIDERFGKTEFAHSEFGLSLRPMVDVLRSGYGSSFELTLLLCSLAKTQGIEAQIVPVISSVTELAVMSGWRKPALSVIPQYGSPFLVDLGGKVSERSDEFARSQKLDLENCQLIPVLILDENSSELRLSLTLSSMAEDTIHGEGALFASGNWGIVQQVAEEGAVEFLSGFVTLPGFECTSARVLELSESGKVGIEFAFSAASLDTADDYRMLGLSLVDFRSDHKNAPWSLLTRDFPQLLSKRGQVSVSLAADIPDGWEVVRHPTTLQENWGSCSGETVSKVENGKLIFERRLKISERNLAPAHWPEFRSWMIESGPRPNNTVVFKQNRGA